MNELEYVGDMPWCEGWTSPADCERCCITECNCNTVPKKRAVLFSANALEVETEDGEIAFIEDQEHCAIFWPVGFEGGRAGQYYFTNMKDVTIDFCIWSHEKIAKVVRCKVLKYSHDYGETWNEVNKDECNNC